jgi:hypothetical protein
VIKRLIFTGLMILLLSVSMTAQTTGWTAGKITYVTSNSVYVRFEGTEDIDIGDTLYIDGQEGMLPALVVNNKSSLSVVCSPIISKTFQQDETVSFKNKPKESELVVAPVAEDADTPTSADLETAENEQAEPEPPERVQQISGRISVSSYTNWTNAAEGTGQRMRYTFSFGGENLGGSKFSIETYLSFVQLQDNWDDIKADIFNGLKIYNFSVRYDITSKTSILVGRKINYRLTSLGAIDGLQFEQQFGKFTLGAVAGSRPDYETYGIDTRLFQYGLYLSHDHQKGNGRMETTLAYLNQTNNGKTDRRFIYLQHTNTLLKNLFFMGTVEFDLYRVESGQAKTTFDLANLYLLLRYRASDRFTLSASYNARQQIIFYETYKDFLERLLNTGTLQGYRLTVNYRPLKRLSIGVRGGYRFRQDDPNPSTDAQGYLAYSMIPGINASATASVTWLETSYLKGWVYSAGLSRDLVPGKLFGGINYRYVSYDFSTSDLPAVQNIAEININWRIYGKLSLSVYYEGTFEKEITFTRIYANITQRF